ncbi:uncharacterized protein C8Q71DRAFT_705868 [Rhodofomes roseus]|uniref:BTB domain-containing protein n=1 Tax=Rhodofomes roseus TaxID=34475 RepID=A0ABQ8KI50_9APHY|nr:uncharacterized protein C8Q71DRAFT_705868 [Rhodofomes roseus]KAH9837633.1 hypothetical protein C8Q71DRAFT_705868 [Rhodofomes roseus]
MTKMAVAPFDNSHGDSDVVLRSADEVDFYVHRNILRIASAFFADMFSLPQPIHPSSPDVANDPIPVIPVSENSQKLEALLRMCYPVEKSRISSVQDVSPLLEGALKYQMREATAALTKKLAAFCNNRPLDVYAEVCRRDLRKVAKQAADAFAAPLVAVTKVPRDEPAFAIDDFTPHMESISAAAYFHLLEYHSGGGASKSMTLSFVSSRASASASCCSCSVSRVNACHRQR